MDKNEIKKALYKQKPTADFNESINGVNFYSCQIDMNGKKQVVKFEVPQKENDFEEVVPAQLLIRWLVIFLLFPFVSFAQTEPQFDKDGNLIIPKEQIQNVFTGLKQNDQCQSYVIKLEQSVTELANELLTIQTVYNDGQQKLKALESERDGLIEESEKLMVDLAVLKASKPKWYQNKWLWFTIGSVCGGYTVSQIR